jgi:hypothetical protein
MLVIKMERFLSLANVVFQFLGTLRKQTQSILQRGKAIQLKAKVEF